MLAKNLSINQEFPPISRPIYPFAPCMGIVSAYSVGWKGDLSYRETVQLCQEYQKTQRLLDNLSIDPNRFFIVFKTLTKPISR